MRIAAKYILLILLCASVRQTTAQGVYQSDPAFGRQFNRVRAGIILTPPYFADSTKLPALPIRYAGSLRIDSTIGSLAYTYTDSTLWTYSGTQWHRLPRTTAPNTLSWTLDTTGQAQGRPLFSGPGNAITSAAWWLIDTTNRKIVINNTNVSIGGPSYRLYVNGKAHAETLTIAGNTTLGKPPTGSSTNYPVAWNSTNQELIQYEQWPDSIVSYGKNATGDSTILLLSNGRRFAALDSTGGGGGGITGIGTFSGTGDAKGASISGTDLILHPATPTEPGGLSTTTQHIAGIKHYRDQLHISPGGTSFGSLRGGGSYFEIESAAGKSLELNRSNTASVIIRGGAASFSGSGNTLGATAFLGNVNLGGTYTFDLDYPSHSAGRFKINANGQSYINDVVGPAPSVSASVLLTLESTTRGFLSPRMTSTQRDAISSPATGLQLYNSTTNTQDYYNGSQWTSLVNTTSAQSVAGSKRFTDSITVDNQRTITFGSSAGNPGLAMSKRIIFDYVGSETFDIRSQQGTDLAINVPTGRKITFHSGNYTGGPGNIFTADANDFTVAARISGNIGNLTNTIPSSTGIVAGSGTSQHGFGWYKFASVPYGTVVFSGNSDYIYFKNEGSSSLGSSTTTATITSSGLIVFGTTKGSTASSSGASSAFTLSTTTQGSIPAPVMTSTQRDAIGTPAAGLRVYNSTTSQPNYRDGSTWQAQVGMTFGTAAPTSTPTAVGNFFLDTTNKKLYVAIGTSSSADWEILN